MLNSEVAFKLFALTNIGDGASVNEGLNAISLSDHAEMIPLVFLKDALLLCKPATKPNSVNPTGSLSIDLNLIAFRFSFCSRTTECEAGIKSRFLGEKHL